MHKVKIIMGRAFPLKNKEISGTFSIKAGDWTEDDLIQLMRFNDKEVEVSLPVQDGDGSVLATAAIGSEIRHQLGRILGFIDSEFPKMSNSPSIKIIPEPCQFYIRAAMECSLDGARSRCPHGGGYKDCEKISERIAKELNEQTNNDNKD